MRISDWSSDVCSSDLHDDPGEGNSANILRTDIVALLRRGQQRVEHLDRRLEHFDEFKKPLVRTIESARIAIGVRGVLREIFQLADIDLADQRRDIRIIFIARLSLGNADLMQARRENFFDVEARDGAVEFVESFAAPRADKARKAAAGKDILILDHRTVGFWND